MAQILSASIYGINGAATGTAEGVTMGFPTQGILIRPAPAGASSLFNTVQAVSIIQMLPSGTKVAQDQYFSVTPVGTLITNSNA